MGFVHRFFLYNVFSIVTTIMIFTVIFYLNGEMVSNYTRAFPFSVACFTGFYTIIIESLFFRKNA